MPPAAGRAHPFLSDEWIAAARAVYAEVRGTSPEPAAAVRLNLVVKDVPFGSGTVDAHVDTSSGSIEIELGHLPDPDVTVTAEYETAKSVLVDQDTQAVMGAFLGGRISVQGDLTRVIALVAQPPADGGEDVAARIRAITT